MAVAGMMADVNLYVVGHKVGDSRGQGLLTALRLARLRQHSNRRDRSSSTGSGAAVT